MMADGLATGIRESDVQQLEDVEHAAYRVGHSSIVAYVRFAKCLVATVHPRDVDFQRQRQMLQDSIDRDAFGYLLAIADGLADPSAIVSWNPETVARWRAIQHHLREVASLG